MHVPEENLSCNSKQIKSVSVVVPNFNYAHYIRERLESILQQSYPIKEIIVLDDASTDDSIHQINILKSKMNDAFRLVANRENAGSVFKQWNFGALETTGEFVWVAEADDLADSTQVARLVQVAAQDPDVVFAFCDSSSIDEKGNKLNNSYSTYYTSDTGDILKRSGIYSGGDFAIKFLSVKNIILNASSVLWRRKALLHALEESVQDLQRLRLCGDWRVYLECLLIPRAKVAYVAAPLNVHRRHSGSVTHKLPARNHLAEVAYMQRLIRHRLGLPEIICDAQDKALANLAKQFSSRQS